VYESYSNQSGSLAASCADDTKNIVVRLGRKRVGSRFGEGFASCREDAGQLIHR
jgi:hypothetical protein